VIEERVRIIYKNSTVVRKKSILIGFTESQN